MGASCVVWDEAEFLARYPQFAGKFESARLNELWKTACCLISNAADAPVPYDPENGVCVREIALYALVCHLAAMALWGASGQSGAAASASEGSVSASFQIPALPESSAAAAWYNQTPCGRTAYLLIKRLSLGGRWCGAKKYHPYG